MAVFHLYNIPETGELLIESVSNSDFHTLSFLLVLSTYHG